LSASRSLGLLWINLSETQQVALTPRSHKRESKSSQRRDFITENFQIIRSTTRLTEPAAFLWYFHSFPTGPIVRSKEIPARRPALSFPKGTVLCKLHSLTPSSNRLKWAGSTPRICN
jgi:hypothetical protein